MKEQIISDLENKFKYHAPKEGQLEKYKRLRSAGKDLALLIQKECPECADAYIAIQRVREAVMYANAAIAINQRG